MVGKTIAHYRILEKLGEGGMGVVYKAHDAKLGREVALKLLWEAFTDAPDRLARFEREARLLASLNHPNVGAIYGLERAGSQPALVLELVPGATLEQRLAAGPMETEEALQMAAQIARALEAAHEKGIIHRDLKPANVKVTPDGTVKVLDFGLGKAATDEATGSAPDTSHSPTKTIEQTRAGVILGTAHYMSPEQSRGKGVDRRSDIWSFGCVLYEMLAGKRAFAGESVSDILAAILRAEPEWSPLPADTPPAIRALLRRCLQKDPNRRLQHIADGRVEIEEALLEPAPPPAETRAASGPRSLRLAWLVAGVLAVVAATALWVPWRKEPKPAVQRLELQLPDEDPLDQRTGFPSVAISADGTRLAYVSDRGTTTRLLLRNLDELEFKPLPGTDGAQSPFFSPDGRWIGFFLDQKLKKAPIGGGAVVSVCDASEVSGGSSGSAVWVPGDTILFVPGFHSDVLRVPAAGGQPQTVLARDYGRQVYNYLWPQWLPDQAGLLVTVNSGSIASYDDARLAWRRGDRTSPQVILTGGTYGRLLPNGYLVYCHRQQLLAAPFHSGRGTVAGGGVPVVERVLTVVNTGAAHYAFSDSGTLAYAAGDLPTIRSSLFAVDRKGATELIADSPFDLCQPSLSPDGRQLAVVAAQANDDVHVYDLTRGTSTRFTFEDGDEQAPVWTPDGRRIAYHARHGRGAHMFWKSVDSGGTPEPILSSERQQFPYSFSPDGKALAFVEFDPSTGRDIWIVTVQGERKAQSFLRTRFDETMPQFSPDGRWLAFVSDESGERCVYVARYPGGGARRRISTGTGYAPRWAPDGRELFYSTGSQLMAVSIVTQPELEVGRPRKLFDDPDLANPYNDYLFAPARDGQRFFITKRTRIEPVRQIHVVLNWFDDVKRKVGAVGK